MFVGPAPLCADPWRVAAASVLSLALAACAPASAEDELPPLQTEFTVSLAHLARFSDVVLEVTFADPSGRTIEIPLVKPECEPYTALVYRLDVVSVLRGPPLAAGARVEVLEANHEALLAAGRAGCESGFAIAPPGLTYPDGVKDVRPVAKAIAFLVTTAGGRLAVAAANGWERAGSGRLSDTLGHPRTPCRAAFWMPHRRCPAPDLHRLPLGVDVAVLPALDALPPAPS